MDELLQYASLAGAGLPAHERHKAKASTIRQLRRVQVDSDGTLRFAEPHACSGGGGPTGLAGLTFSVRDGQGSRQVVLRAAADDRVDIKSATDPATDGTPPRARKARKLILLAY